MGAYIALCFIWGSAAAADIDPKIDEHALEEVRTLSKLPVALAMALGSQGGENDRIANLEPGGEASRPASFDRWFLLAGLSENYALVAIEERAGLHRFDHIHANAFSRVGSDWVATEVWVLNFPPHTLGELLQLVRSPESQAATARWQKWQREQDLQKRMAESDPTATNRHVAPYRENDINDEEIRQIEGVVRELIPGGIVMISGVAKGCPCEDGPNCAAQIWIAVHLPRQTRSLELSDINDRWVIGPVQQWFLESVQLERSKYPTRVDFDAARAAMDDRYPTCATEASIAH
jgi:hypothetical protein